MYQSGLVGGLPMANPEFWLASMNLALTVGADPTTQAEQVSLAITDPCDEQKFPVPIGLCDSR